jgi:hypothetical protein
VKRLRILVMVMTVLFATATLARGEVFQATLTGNEEVPVVSTSAIGLFYAISSGDSIVYSLFYTQMQGTVTQAHIHLAQPAVNGAIIIWLCQTASNIDPTGLSPQCPQKEGTVTGTITSASVIASAPAQQLAAGDIQAAIAAMRGGVAYANVHTNLSTGGEIRGQVRLLSK